MTWAGVDAQVIRRFGAGHFANRGIVAAVAKGKDTLLLKAYGKADVEGDVPATVDTVFAIGSDTKQFTAAAILPLRDQGKLSLQGTGSPHPLMAVDVVPRER